jgi:hypothetical protein
MNSESLLSVVKYFIKKLDNRPRYAIRKNIDIQLLIGIDKKNTFSCGANLLTSPNPNSDKNITINIGAAKQNKTVIICPIISAKNFTKLSSNCGKYENTGQS